jgi:hypothetical protein
LSTCRKRYGSSTMILRRMQAHQNKKMPRLRLLHLGAVHQ